MPVELTDLRSITRDSDTCLTTVYIKMSQEERRVEWLVFGQAQIRIHHRPSSIWLTAYLKDGATDFEHDSAYALRLPLIGLEFEGVRYHTTMLKAWIDPNEEDEDGDFHVPRPGYNPMELDEAEVCKECEEQHIIVPEDFYVPPFNKELFDLVRGKEVDIRIGQSHAEAE